MYKISELLCSSHDSDDYQEDFGQRCPICALKEVLHMACDRLNDGSAWAEESEEFLEMCKLSGYNHPASRERSDDENI